MYRGFMANKFSTILSTLSIATGVIGVNMIGMTAWFVNTKPASAYNICGNNGRNIVNYETENYWVSICDKDRRDYLVSSRKDNRGDRFIARVQQRDGGWRGDDRNNNLHNVDNRRYQIIFRGGRDLVEPVINVTQGTNNDAITSRPQTCNKDYRNIENYETRNHWVNICQRQNRYYLFSHNKNHQANSKVMIANRQNNGWYGRDNDYQYMINNQLYQITYQNRPRVSEPVIRGGSGNRPTDPIGPITPGISQNKQRRTCFVNRPQGLFVFSTTNSSTNPIRTLRHNERIEIFGNMIPNNAGQRFVQLTSPTNGYIVASDTTANYLRDCSQPW
jgi:hypothetical protein